MPTQILDGSWLIGGMAFAQPLVLLLLVWSLFWKGVALWTSARRKQGWWFLILLIVNTLGILEILYLFVFTKEGLREVRTGANTHS